jgi:aspartyl-tRNA(Asn)/glutamyl-tRNA(Gln) amidotransferase subunit C
MLTPAEVERIALLGRLALSDEEKSKYARQLSAVLDYASELAKVDVEGIPPTASVLPVRGVMRTGDAPSASLPREEALANAPRADGESFVVQATFEN